MDMGIRRWETKRRIWEYVDGKPREARMIHPKGLTIDVCGSIYIADTTNTVVRNTFQ